MRTTGACGRRRRTRRTRTNPRQIYSTGQAGLTRAGESRRSSRFSGQIRVMQRPELVTTRRPAAATAAELEQHGTVRGRRRQRKESEKGPSGRPIYKGELISGRENQGDRGVVISPRNASILGRTVNAKIRCESGGVKNGLNGR